MPPPTTITGYLYPVDSVLRYSERLQNNRNMSKNQCAGNLRKGILHLFGSGTHQIERHTSYIPLPTRVAASG